MDTKDAVGLRAGQHLDETGWLAHTQRTTIGHERNLANLVGDAFRLELLFALADPGNFRSGIDDAWNGVEVAVTSLTSHQLGNHDALFHGLVRQHRSAHNVADRPDPWEIGLAVTIDFNHAAIGQLEANCFAIEAIGIRDAANGNDQAVGIELLGFTILRFVGNRDALLGRLDIADLDSGLDVQTLLGEQLERFLGDVLIGKGQEVGHCF